MASFTGPDSRRLALIPGAERSSAGGVVRTQGLETAPEPA